MGLLLGLDRGHPCVRNVEEQRTSYDKGSGNADRHCAGASPSDVPAPAQTAVGTAAGGLALRAQGTGLDGAGCISVGVDP